MDLLVTGGAGYIGSHLTDALLESGHRVTVLDNLTTGSRTNLEPALATGRCELVEGDIREARTVERLVARSQGVFHLAAVVGVKHVIEHPLEMMLVNVDGTANVLAAAASSAVPIMVASSSEVYGDGAREPFQEEEESVIGPTSQPRWGYALAKALDEHLAFAYHADQGLPTVAVRYFNSYGPRMDGTGYGSVIAKFIAQALREEPLTVYGDGTQSRAFTYIDDTVHCTIVAFEKMLERPEVRGKVFNAGYPHATSILELAEQIRQLTGAKSEIEFVPFEKAYGRTFAEPKRRIPDMTRSRDLLGFEPQVPLAEGLRRTLAWARRAYVQV
ncbi:MAG TPA: NAD-dependent epimerase/dehydratase family protein [bacterium]|nr:NAD-dependent epimerase/dehydratase family protein [bacterium]